MGFYRRRKRVERETGFCGGLFDYVCYFAYVGIDIAAFNVISCIRLGLVQFNLI